MGLRCGAAAVGEVLARCLGRRLRLMKGRFVALLATKGTFSAQSGGADGAEHSAT